MQARLSQRFCTLRRPFVINDSFFIACDNSIQERLLFRGVTVKKSQQKHDRACSVPSKNMAPTWGVWKRVTSNDEWKLRYPNEHCVAYFFLKFIETNLTKVKLFIPPQSLNVTRKWTMHGFNQEQTKNRHQNKHQYEVAVISY